MSNSVVSYSDQQEFRAATGVRAVVAIVFAVWLALVFWFGAREVFVAPRGTPPVALLIAVVGPVIIFLVAFWSSPRFHEFVLTANLHLMTGMQAWRFGGFAFLALYTYEILPGFFAWPAGLGDMAIGVTAPWILVALIRRPSFAASQTFVTWNVLGILDLVVAVGSAALGPLLGLTGATRLATAPMAHLPLVLIPAYLVPMFVILHLSALFQSRGRREV